MKTNKFGAYIRCLRLKNHMTQSQLADKLYITDKAVSKWERDLSYPDIKLFPKLADVLGVNMIDLLNESIEEVLPSNLVQVFEMSHDFRTPLHIILGCVDLAENHYENKDRVQRYLHSIRASGEYLLEVINKAMQTPQLGLGQSVNACSLAGDLDEYLKEEKCAQKVCCTPHDFSGKRILVADDMEINREILGELLSQHGAELEFAEDGQICLDKVIANPADYYELILMDIRMPNMDGIEATRNIRQLSDSRKASIPIIAVTANIHAHDRKAAIEAGMNAFTEKPISVEKLFMIMEHHFIE